MYLKLEGPETLRLSDGSRVRSASEYTLWHAEQIGERGLARVRVTSALVVAYVNHGRWIADCPACTTPMFTRPDWAVAYCIECGARYTGVLFPPFDVSAVLCRRPRRDTQNWRPGESLDALRAENVAHGLE